MPPPGPVERPPPGPVDNPPPGPVDNPPPGPVERPPPGPVDKPPPGPVERPPPGPVDWFHQRPPCAKAATGLLRARMVPTAKQAMTRRAITLAPPGDSETAQGEYMGNLKAV